MQEGIENRTVNFAISTTKLTVRVLLSAFQKYLQYHRNVKAARKNQKPIGEQTIAELIGQNQGAVNIEIENTDIRGFKRYLEKYGIDYALTQDSSQTPPRYLVFFKSRDGDAMTAAFREYSTSVIQKKEKSSVLQKLKQFKEIVAALPKKVREKKQEREI